MPTRLSLFLGLCLALSLSACGHGREVESSTWSYPTTQGPWDGTLVMATSTDGLNFGTGTPILEQSGVPNLLELQDGSLVLTCQYFSKESREEFDVIAYSISDDKGATWSETQLIQLEDLPVPLDSKKMPMDPTLVQLEDGRLRLYFTYHAAGNKTAALYSATTKDNEIASAFVVEETPALMVEENLLDPAVVFFDGVWHHYSWRLEDDDNYHSTSNDGVSFTREDDVNLPMDFLGQVIAVDGGLRFYGTGYKGVTTAFSEDGYSWEVDHESVVQGADPAVQELSDGTYLMVYTSMNFNK